MSSPLFTQVSLFGGMLRVPGEAEPGQPLPDAGPFLRVFAGAEEPATLMLRAGRACLLLYQQVHRKGRDIPDSVHEELSLLVWLINREATTQLSTVEFAPDAPENPTSYGEIIAWLSFKYLRYTLNQADPTHGPREAAVLLAYCKALDQLVVDVNAGLVRLPEQLTEVMPPQMVRPKGSDPDGALQATRFDGL
uniref:hypothetical protein n=1 Tax=Nocardia suismassiliense TaxID=2077092 RepID=UPI003F490D1F